MPTAHAASKPTSLKLPAALKAQLEVVAQDAGLSLHAFMIQTLADSVQRTRLRETFALDAMTALHDMKEGGSGYELSDVRAYFSHLTNHRKGLEAKPKAPLPTPLR